MDDVLSGRVAEIILRYLLDNYNFGVEGRCYECQVAGYFKEGEFFTCFDNTTGSCYVETAKTEKKALQWCLKEIDVSDLYEDNEIEKDIDPNSYF